MTTWEVFYTPHTDDESIGMAGAITRALDEGRQALVVLVTDNEPSVRGRRLFADQVDLPACRLKEWYLALRALGVVAYEHWNISERHIRDNPFAAQSEIFRRIHDVHMTLRPVHHHTVWGSIDVHPESGFTSISHVLCANALAIFAAECADIRVSLHGIYVYGRQMEHRTAPTIRQLTDAEYARKQDALHAYGPSDQCIGYGYKSVPELIDAAHADPREFVIEVQYRNGFTSVEE